MSDEQTALEREACYFHSWFFGRPAPAAVVARYVAANRLCCPEINAGSRRMLEALVGRRLDVEALELFLRLRYGNRVLTRKTQILFYLVEVRAEYYSYFVNQKPGLGRALSELSGAVMATVWKCIKGWYLVSTNDFV